MEFDNWLSFKSFIEYLGLGPIFNGCGIFKNKQNVLFLRSVDNTHFYKDDFEGDIKYTLYGQIGDQVLDNRYNKHIITGNKAYLYRVNGKRHIWYGLVEMEEIESLRHPDKNDMERVIYRVNLKKI